MKDLSTFVPVTLAGVLLAAMVTASPLTSETKGTVATAPNQAEVFAVTVCAEQTGNQTAQAQSWHQAHASKRVLDRSVVLAKDSASGSCRLFSQELRPLP